MAEEEKALIVGPTEIKEEDDDSESNKAGPSKAKKKKAVTLYAELRSQFYVARSLIDQVGFYLQCDLGSEVITTSQLLMSLDLASNDILLTELSEHSTLRRESHDALSSAGWALEDEKMHIEPKQGVSHEAAKLHRSLGLRKSSYYQVKTGSSQQHQLDKSPTLALWGREEQESHTDSEQGGKRRCPKLQLDKSPTLAFWGKEEQESLKDPEHRGSKLRRSSVASKSLDYIVEGVPLSTQGELVLGEPEMVKDLMEVAGSLLKDIDEVLTNIGENLNQFQDEESGLQIWLKEMQQKEGSSSASGGNTERQKREEERGPRIERNF